MVHDKKQYLPGDSSSSSLNVWFHSISLTKSLHYLECLQPYLLGLALGPGSWK